jgi:hypothetical protein
MADDGTEHWMTTETGSAAMTAETESAAAGTSLRVLKDTTTDGTDRMSDAAATAGGELIVAAHPGTAGSMQPPIPLLLLLLLALPIRLLVSSTEPGLPLPIRLIQLRILHVARPPGTLLISLRLLAVLPKQLRCLFLALLLRLFSVKHSPPQSSASVCHLHPSLTPTTLHLLLLSQLNLTCCLPTALLRALLPAMPLCGW